MVTANEQCRVWFILMIIKNIVITAVTGPDAAELAGNDEIIIPVQELLF